MRRVWQQLGLIQVIALCGGQSKGNLDQDRCQEPDNLARLLQEVRELRKTVETIAIRQNFVMGKIASLDRKLDDVTRNLSDHLQNLNDTIGQTVEAIRASGKESKKELGKPMWTCCFKKLQLKESSLNSVEKDISVTGVPTQEGCVTLCHHRQQCHAVFYNETQQLCSLLKDHHPQLEPTGRTVIVWVKSSSGLGKCPPRFNIRWEDSRYLWVNRPSLWGSAQTWCAHEGGKLAELTSRLEIEGVGPQLNISRTYLLLGGAQDKGGKEPGGGWRWQLSNMTIPTDGFRWCPGEPNNFSYKGYNESVISAIKIEGAICFNDCLTSGGFIANYRKIVTSGLSQGFLCECIDFRG